MVVSLMPDASMLRSTAAQEDDASTEGLLLLVYEELRRMAQVRMAGEAGAHTLQPTALVHEVWLKMVDGSNRSWKSRGCFLSAASSAMRRILIDHARKKRARKRGGVSQKIALELIEQATPEQDEAMLLVEEALQRLERVRPDWARIVVMKYYGGMTNKEVADSLEIGESSVERYWSGARALLYKYLTAAT